MNLDKYKETSYYKYLVEDKSKYKSAREAGYIDPDDDFVIGESGGFIFNNKFTFVNTDLLRERAIYYERNKKYTDLELDSRDYNKFVEIEQNKRKFGHVAKCGLYPDGSIKNIRITGAHYNFLNYVNILKVEENNKKGKNAADKVVGFPRVFFSQYIWFKIKEFAENNGFNLIMGKSRRGGFTYMEASDTANDTNLYPRRTSIYAAYDKKYLTQADAISGMTKKMLEFYEFNTPFNRCGINMETNEPNGLLKKDIEELILGYKTKSGTDAGYLSKVISVSFGPNNPDAAIGKDAKKVKIDELSNAPNLSQFLDVTEPTTRAGLYTTGMIVGWGTGGSKEGSFKAFDDWFNNPTKYNAMPFENIWDEDARHLTCGFFKPYHESLEGKDEFGNYAMDKNGNSDYLIAMSIIDNQRDEIRKKKTNSEYITYCGQYCNKPSEAFSSSVDNIFNSPELKNHTEENKKNRNIHYRDGVLVEVEGNIKFKSNDSLSLDNIKIHDFIDKYPLPNTFDRVGCIREYFAPIRIGGKVPNNLYRIWYDPYGIDKDKDKINYKDSLACIIVYKLSTPEFPGEYIAAMYIGRKDTTDDDDTIALNLADYYNGTVLAEINRGTFIKTARRLKKLHRCTAEPISVWDSSMVGKDSTNYGITITPQRKLDALSYFRDWLYTKVSESADGKCNYRLNYIKSNGILDELSKYNTTGNFDRISTLLVGMFDIQNVSIHPKKPTTNKKSQNNIFNRQWY